MGKHSTPYKTGDIYIDPIKREAHPESSWGWTLVKQTMRPRPTFDPALRGRGELEPVWHAVYGRGKSGGYNTIISERRLSKLMLVGNVEDGPRRVRIPSADEWRDTLAARR